MEFSSASILDIGCGTGIYTLPLACEAAMVTGIDDSETMLARMTDVMESESTMHPSGSKEDKGCEHQERHRSGPSSFGMHDTDLVFKKLALKPGDVFLDLGCGPGDYAMYASLIVGASGMVYAIDKWERMVTGICTEAAMMGYANVCSLLADICAPLPLGDASVDVCLLATVLHTLNMARDGSAVFGEVRRVLKPAGRLAIINCKKEAQPFGPPVEKRFSAQETENLVVPSGFRTLEEIDLGYNYLIQFRID